MPLLPCPECGKEISTNAAACPNCGAPRKMAKKAKAGWPLWRWLVCLCGIAILAVSAWQGYFTEIPHPWNRPNSGQGQPIPQFVGQNGSQGQQWPASRDAFRAMLMGKTPDETIRLAGRPDLTGGAGFIEIWTYKAKTFDPVTNRQDTEATVQFSRGKVSDILFVGGF